MPGTGPPRIQVAATPMASLGTDQVLELLAGDAIKVVGKSPIPKEPLSFALVGVLSIRARPLHGWSLSRIQSSLERTLKSR